MQYLTKLSTSPAEAVSLGDMRAWLKQEEEDAAEDALIGGAITAARVWAEGYQRTSLVSEQFRLRLDRFFQCPRNELGVSLYDGLSELWELPDLYHPNAQRFAIELPRGPLVTIDAFSYLDAAGLTQTLTAPAYQVVTGDDVPPRIFPADGTIWPMTKFDPAAITIDFTAGYTADTIPANTLIALKMITAQIYEDRGGSMAIPPCAKTLLALNRKFAV